MKKFTEKHWKKVLVIVFTLIFGILMYGIIDLLIINEESAEMIVDNIQSEEVKLNTEETEETYEKKEVSENISKDNIVENKDEKNNSDIAITQENEESEKKDTVEKVEVQTDASKENENNEPKIDLEKDTDNDGAEDYIEDYFGTDKTKEDTDGDGLSDFIELYSLVLEPLSTDTDANGIFDGDEDLDGDELTNLEEIISETNIIYADTDGDSLSDYDEIEKYSTDPLKIDTDDDGVSDAKEIEMGTDSLFYEEIFHIVEEAMGEDTLKVSVETILSGKQVESLTVERYENEFLFPTTMPGYIGGAYDFSVDGDLGRATIRFEFDESLLSTSVFEPVIYYFDEENQVLEEIETTVNGNVASAEVTHFSKYILLNKRYYQNAFAWKPISIVNGYTTTEVIFIISETNSIQEVDSNDVRYTIVDNAIERLPICCAIGVMKYDKGLTAWKKLVWNKKYAKECIYGKHLDNASGIAFAGYCDDNDDTDYAVMNSAIREAIEFYSYQYDGRLKIFVVLGESRVSDESIYRTVMTKAKKHNIKIYTVEFGEDCNDLNYMQQWSDDTNGMHYYASDIEDTTILSDDIFNEMYKDTDKDGIPDYYEDNLQMFNGVKIKLDKNNPDTDGDGLLDGEEIGELQYQYDMTNKTVLVTTKAFSDPLSKDTDLDEIADEEEVVIGTSQFNVDTDSDGLLDGTEYIEGFDPLDADADGDGRLDWREYEEGTDPYVYNKEWNEHVWEFTCGVIAGDFITDSDSFATTAGQIVGSFIPGIDVRDIIANLQQGNYMMAGLSSTSLISGYGDSIKAIGKVGEYATKHADDAAKIGEISTFLSKNFPDLAKALGLSDEFVDVAKQLAKTENLKLTRTQRKILIETFENAGLSHYLLKTSNLDGLKETVDITEDVWEKGACERGRIIDEFINEHLLGKGLGTNFPVADRIDNRILVSTKSLDIAAQSYQNPSKLRSMLNKYASDLNNFEKKYFKGNDKLEWGKKELKLSEYNKKALEIVLPDTMITEDILAELNSFKETMDKAGIEIWYCITKSQ